MKLEVKDLRKSFGDKEVLHGISFSIESGKALGLLGRNGAGKNDDHPYSDGCLSCQFRDDHSR